MKNYRIFWTRKCGKFISVLELNKSGILSGFKIKNCGDSENIEDVINRYVSDSDKPYKLYILSGLNRDEGIRLLLVSAKNNDHLKKAGKNISIDLKIFGHVLEIHEEIISPGKSTDESALNDVLKQVYHNKPDIIFIALNSGNTETIISNLLKVAGYKHVIGSHKLSGYFNEN